MGKNISQRTYPGDDIQRNMNLDINYQKERYFFSDPFTARTIRGTVDFVSFVHIFPDIEVISNILGHLVINIDHDLLEKELNTGSDDFDALVILNKNKKVIMQKGEPIDLSVFTFGDDNFVESSQGFAYINENLYDDWTVIAYKSYESVYSRLQYIYLFVIITILSSIAVIIFINTSIIASITKPITKLTNAMKKVTKGDLQVSVSCTSGDEIQLLTEGFNNMLLDIQNYIDQIIENEKRQKKDAD